MRIRIHKNTQAHALSALHLSSFYFRDKRLVYLVYITVRSGQKHSTSTLSNMGFIWKRPVNLAHFTISRHNLELFRTSDQFFTQMV